MKSLPRMLYGLAGLVLLAAYLLTGTYGLSPQNKQSYALALQMQDTADTLHFKNFHLADFPVAFYDGEQEYVFFENQIHTREPVYAMLVASIYEAGPGKYEVIVPILEDMGRVVEFASRMQFTADHVPGYDEKTHATVLWHEAFHAWQFTHFKENIEAPMQAVQDKEEIASDEYIRQEMDDQPQAKELFEQEIQLLLQAAGSQDPQIRRTLLKQYWDLRDSRHQLLSPQMRQLESFFEQVEGSAQYVESMIYLAFKGQDAYNSKYIQPAGQYHNGTAKYYNSGMLKCLLLDAICPGWQASYQWDQNLDALLRKALE